jgi:hypothetical protein
MGVITHGVSRRDPSQEITHRTITVGPQNQMPMIRQQLKREQRDGLTGITAIQGMVKPASFISTWSSWHVNSLPQTLETINES